jgi:hypothetical protein
MIEPDRPQVTIWLMRIACWITNAADTHPEYVILIAFPRQQLLHERASMLSYPRIVLDFFVSCVLARVSFASVTL